MNASTDNRALLHSVRGRLVREIASDDNPYARALWEIVRQRSKSWQPGEFDAALAELDASEQTIEAFLSAEHARRAL